MELTAQWPTSSINYPTTTSASCNSSCRTSRKRHPFKRVSGLRKPCGPCLTCCLHSHPQSYGHVLQEMHRLQDLRQQVRSQRGALCQQLCKPVHGRKQPDHQASREHEEFGIREGSAGRLMVMTLYRFVHREALEDASATSVPSCSEPSPNGNRHRWSLRDGKPVPGALIQHIPPRFIGNRAEQESISMYHQM